MIEKTESGYPKTVFGWVGELTGIERVGKHAVLKVDLKLVGAFHLD